MRRPAPSPASALPVGAPPRQRAFSAQGRCKFAGQEPPSIVVIEEDLAAAGTAVRYLVPLVRKANPQRTTHGRVPSSTEQYGNQGLDPFALFQLVQRVLHITRVTVVFDSRFRRLVNVKWKRLEDAVGYGTC